PLSVRLIAALRILPYLLFFTLVIRQPPWPTPFPYTTLFRSVDRQAQSRLPEGRQRWRRGPVRRDRRGVGLFGGIRRTSRTGEAGGGQRRGGREFRGGRLGLSGFARGSEQRTSLERRRPYHQCGARFRRQAILANGSARSAFCCRRTGFFAASRGARLPLPRR